MPIAELPAKDQVVSVSPCLNFPGTVVLVIILHHSTVKNPKSATQKFLKLVRVV